MTHETTGPAAQSALCTAALLLPPYRQYNLRKFTLEDKDVPPTNRQVMVMEPYFALSTAFHYSVRCCYFIKWYGWMGRKTKVTCKTASQYSVDKHGY